jgi:hypothetical protein
MTAGGLLRELSAIPAADLPGEAAWRLRRRWWQLCHAAVPQACSYTTAEPGAPLQLFQEPARALAASPGPSLASWCARYLRHEFNVLGSGWRRVSVERDAPMPGGLVNPGNAARAAQLFAMLDSGYSPIDWQIDFKSDFRWSAATWHRDVRFGDVAGADVKVPWELARMQHLPQVALAAGAGLIPTAQAVREMRNQVLDFISANPPGWGIHWSNPMEAAIRAANWLIARDLLLAAGSDFDADFDAVLRASMYDHGRHLAANLEWHPRYRGNHYLANLAGLLFCGAGLEGEEADGWLAFTIRELEAETARQFNRDGGSFEASTSYHRLSGEIAAFATAAALALPSARIGRLARIRPRLVCAQHGLRARPLRESSAPFGAAHLENLRRIARFALAVTKPGGRVVQIGDNDSGRFARLAWTERDGDEDSLDHRHLVAMIDTLPRGGTTAGAPPAASGLGREDAWREIGALEAVHTSVRVLARGPGLTRNLSCAAFPDFGLYVLRSDRLWLSVRCGESGIEPLGAHSHNDQLAIELVLDGEELVRDPGSYVYTSDPGLRNAYRSAFAHDVPRIAGREPAGLGEGLFLLRGRTGARCLHFSARGFVGLHQGYGVPVWRRVSLTDDELKVEDGSAAGALEVKHAPPPFSPGYGRREA